MKIKSYKDLNIWKGSIEVVEDVYNKITKNFPKGEIYGLTSQLKRSAVSIPSNITEGKSLPGSIIKDIDNSYLFLWGVVLNLILKLLSLYDWEF